MNEPLTALQGDLKVANVDPRDSLLRRATPPAVDEALASESAAATVNPDIEKKQRKLEALRPLN